MITIASVKTLVNGQRNNQILMVKFISQRYATWTVDHMEGASANRVCVIQAGRESFVRRNYAMLAAVNTVNARTEHASASPGGTEDTARWRVVPAAALAMAHVGPTTSSGSANAMRAGKVATAPRLRNEFVMTPKTMIKVILCLNSNIEVFHII